MSEQIEASQFESTLRLIPLGDDIEARIDRVEAIIELIARTGLHGTIGENYFSTRTGSLPIASTDAFNRVLDRYRKNEDTNSYLTSMYGI